MDKLFITAQELLEDSFRLGLKVHQSGFEPDFIVGIWRGGTPVGIAVQELFEFLEIKSDHIAVRTSSYAGMDRREAEVKVDGLDYVVENITARHKLLIVDDVFDTGLSIQAFINALKAQAGSNTPTEIRVACPWFKPANNRTDPKLLPDYYLHETDQWLVFPHELKGLTLEEIGAGKPEAGPIVEQLRLASDKKLRR